MSTRHWAMLGLVFNAFTWGVSWWPFRQMQAQGLHPLWVTAIAFTLAVALLLVAWPQALGLLWRNRSLWWLVLGAGCTNACFNWAVAIGDVVRVVLLFYLMPLWAVLLARLLLGERISQRGALRVLLALVGAAVVLWPEAGTVSAAATGTAQGPSGSPLANHLAIRLADGLALLGGFSFALNNVLLKREAHQAESARALAMFAGGALVALLLAVALQPSGQVPWPPAPAPGWLAATAALALWFVASNLTLQYGAARLPANTTSVVMITEVVFASLSAVALGAGTLGARTALGGLMIVGAALLAAVQRD